MGNFFVGCYLRLAPYRAHLFAACCLFFALCALCASRLSVSQDVRALIPDSPPTLARDLERLSSAPFAHHAMVTVGGERTNPLALAQRIRELAAAEGLRPLVLPDPQRMSPKTALRALDCLPSLLDADRYDERLSERIFARGEEQMRENMREMRSLRGFVRRDFTAKDPFALHTLALSRFTGISFMAGARFREGNIVSEDGGHALLLFAAPTSMTDSSGAARFMDALRRAVRDVPPDAELLITGGHRHSAENAAVVQDDLKRVLPLSLMLSALICLAFIRSRLSPALLVLPLAGLCAASGITAFVFGGLSGIVLGFGGVLLGITADYAVHVHYALRGAQSPERGIRAVATPLFLAALTSVSAFAVLFFSRIPVLSQLAVFAASGLMFALACALCVLPQFIVPAGTRPNAEPAGDERRTESVRPRPRALLALWICLAACLAVLSAQIRIDGDIRRLGYISPQLKHDEERTRRIWGGAREGGLVVVSGGSLEEVLRKNEDATAVLLGMPEAGSVTSLSALLPSERTQNERHKLWREYWERHAPDAVRLLGEFGEREGFAAGAFAPFEKWTRAEPSFVTPAALDDAGFGFLRNMLLLRDEKNGRFSAYILHSENIAFSPEAGSALAAAGAHPLSAARFRQEMSEASGRDIVLFGVAAFCVLALLLLLTQRSPARAAFVLAAPGCGLAAVFCYFYLAGVALNIYHIVALPLIMGLGVDYGIFMLYRDARTNTTRRAVLVSSLTTLAAFACLTPARHPALFSLGGTVCCGVTGAVLCALFLMPLLESRSSGTKEEG